MGSAMSDLNKEKRTWEEHTLQYDSEVRRANLTHLDDFKNGERLYLSYTDTSWGGLKFQHWFVTDRIHFLEFGSANGDIYDARVTINTLPKERYPIGSKNGHTGETDMDEEIRTRMSHVLGMCNYSLCFRNCEHVANYVVRGRWVSHQMEIYQPRPVEVNYDGTTPLQRVGMFFVPDLPAMVTGLSGGVADGPIAAVLKKHLLEHHVRIINSFPASIRPHVFNSESRLLYSFLQEYAVPNRFDYYLDYEEDTYNILLLGPTGAGKSHLINTFFNREVCQAQAGHRSVTREIYFVRGTHNIYNNETGGYEMRKIVVADTVGLCDTDWNEDKTINLIRNRIDSNFKYLDAILIVFEANRMQQTYVENIRKTLKWLRYDQDTASRFLFIGTHGEGLDEADRARMGKDIVTTFELFPPKLTSGQSRNPVLYTGFQAENMLNDLGKQRFLEGWTSLLEYIDNKDAGERIDLTRVKVKDLSCTIL